MTASLHRPSTESTVRLLDTVAVVPTHGTESLTGVVRQDLADHRDEHGDRSRFTGAHGLALIEELAQVALTGRGGGHFPTAAKWRSVLAHPAGGTVVVNGAEGEPGCAKDSVLLQTRPHLVLDGLVSAIEAVGAHDGVVWLRDGSTGTPLAPLGAARLPGRHMTSNVVAACAIAHVAGATPSGMVTALESFAGLEHVLELVAEIDGVRFVNDSKATNVDAAGRAIESFDGVVAIVGGKYKGGRFEDLIGPLSAHGRAVAAIGEARPLVRAALAGTVPVVDAGSMDDAVAKARELARPKGVVLLAPACSSFDMFADYAARGRAFKAAVGNLAARG